MKIKTIHKEQGVTLLVNDRIEIRDENDVVVDNIIECLRNPNVFIFSEAAEIADIIRENLDENNNIRKGE